jgi:NAD+ kinase
MAGWTSLFSVVLLTHVFLVAEGFFLGGPRVSARSVCGVLRGNLRLSSVLRRAGDEEQELLNQYSDPTKATSKSSQVETTNNTTSRAATTIRMTGNNNNSGNKKDPPEQRPTTTTTKRSRKRRNMTLTWCGNDLCTEHNLREKVVDNQIVLSGPATGQVAYTWNTNDYEDVNSSTTTAALSSVLILIKKQQQQPQPSDDPSSSSSSSHLLEIAANVIKQLTTRYNVQRLKILLDPDTAAKLCYYHGVDSTRVELFEHKPCPGFGENPSAHDIAVTEFKDHLPMATPDLICTLGGDGLLMHAAMLFQGPVPPILCVSGGSLGFLTTIQPEEMTEALEMALGLVTASKTTNKFANSDSSALSAPPLQVFPPNMREAEPSTSSTAGDSDDDDDLSDDPRNICVSIRMRLDCRIINREGIVRTRYNVLNEVVIDRGGSPYLAALECFCDNVHLTTVQADGVIFATPTGSTAYALAAGASVVHPAVPSILVTPICPHVLSFRPMVFPDHVVLRCFVPDDARSEASVAFDGKHRQSLRRGESVQIRLSAYPVSTINRQDHSSDWLDSLKRNFNFNSRPRQGPL